MEKQTSLKKLNDSIHKEHYGRIPQKLTQNAPYARKMSRMRSCWNLGQFYQYEVSQCKRYQKRKQTYINGEFNLQLEEIIELHHQKNILTSQVISLKQGKDFAFLKTTFIDSKNSIVTQLNFYI